MVEVTHFSPDMPVVLVGCKIDLRGDAGVRDELKIAGQHLVSTEEVCRAHVWYLFLVPMRSRDLRWRQRSGQESTPSVLR